MLQGAGQRFECKEIEGWQKGHSQENVVRDFQGGRFECTPFSDLHRPPPPVNNDSSLMQIVVLSSPWWNVMNTGTAWTVWCLHRYSCNFVVPRCYPKMEQKEQNTWNKTCNFLVPRCYREGAKRTKWSNLTLMWANLPVSLTLIKPLAVATINKMH